MPFDYISIGFFVLFFSSLSTQIHKLLEDGQKLLQNEKYNEIVQKLRYGCTCFSTQLILHKIRSEKSMQTRDIH